MTINRAIKSFPSGKRRRLQALLSPEMWCSHCEMILRHDILPFLMSLISRRNLRCFVCWFCPIRELKSSHIRSRICLTNWPSRGSQIYNWNVRGNILINMLKLPPMWDQRWHLCGLITPQLGQRLIALKYSLVTRLVGIRGAFLSGSGAGVSAGTLLLWKVKPMGEFSLQYDIGPHTGKCIFSQH